VRTYIKRAGRNGRRRRSVGCLGVCLAGLAALAAGAGDVSAQSATAGTRDRQGNERQGNEQGTEDATPGRPYRGLFQGANQVDRPPTLVLNVDLYGAYDDNVLAGNSQRPRPTLPGLQTSGFFGGGHAGLAYSRQARYSSLSVQAGGGARYYPDLDRVDHTIDEGIAYGRQVGRYTTLSISQAFMFTPNYRFNLFPGAEGEDDPDAGAATDTDFDLFRREAYRNTVGAELSKTIGRRGTFTTGGSFRTVNFVSAGARDFWSISASGDYQYQSSTNLTLRAGYGFHQADAGSSGRPARIVHDFDLGVDYGRQLSFSRRTRVSFSTGSGFLMGVRTAAGDQLRGLLRVTGSAQIVHEIGRTWTARAAYRRGFQFREGFLDPFLTDGVTVSLNGLIARRVDFNANASYVNASRRGNLGGYDATGASVQLRYGLTRNLGVYARYNFYDYHFADLADVSTVDELFYPQGQRNGVRIGLNAYVPLKR
jgi:hypothetical protein